MVGKGLDDFHVEWDPNIAQSFYADDRARDAEANSPIKHLFDWEELDHRGQIRPVGQRFRHLLFSTLDLPDEEEWRFERPLGKGSFGAAGLYTKANEKQEVEDAFALKVTDSHNNLFVKGKKIGLSEEAAVMAQTNDLQSDSILRLRQYKTGQHYCRYYFEFCEHDSLDTLHMRYRAWNTYFPEPFLWHVFYYLAEAYLKFTTGPFRSLTEYQFGEILPDEYLLHNDIKLENILLGTHIARNGEQAWYPIPKVADFGLSVTTNPAEKERNRARNLQRGTKPWYTPEQRIDQMKDYRNYHFQQDVQPPPRDLSKDKHRIRPEANIWGLGAVMWSLMTLNEIEDLSGVVDQILQGVGPAARSFDGTNILRKPDPEVKKRYRPELFNLIQQCTRIKPGDRPRPDALLQEVHRHMISCMEREMEVLAQTNDRTPMVVACIRNEINTLPDGGQDFKKASHFWRDFAGHLLWVPKEWGPLCPPLAPDVLSADETWPSQVRARFEQDWDAAVRDRDGKAVAMASVSRLDSGGQKRTAVDAFDDEDAPFEWDDGDYQQQPPPPLQHPRTRLRWK